MSEPPSESDLPVWQCRRIDERCTEFERLWRDGSRPRVEDFLDDVAGPEREQLLTELVRLDAEYRHTLGEAVTASDYHGLMPGVDAAWFRIDPNRTASLPLPADPPIREDDFTLPPGYEAAEFVAEGGMGRVYKAVHPRLKSVVALKVLSPRIVSEQAKVRFKREAEAIALLQHRHVIEVFEFGEHNGRPYILLEYCGGGTLADRLEEGFFTFEETARILIKLAEAVQAAHQVRVIHRDLKPSNVLYTADGELKVTDFGLAKSPDWTEHTVAGAVLGTPAYMAPEQAGDNENVTKTADVYGLGAILYQMLTGVPPGPARVRSAR